MMDFDRDKVRPGMMIHDADGRELGVVERIEGDEIVVGQHRVPHGAFERMEQDRLHLGRSGSQYFSGAGSRGGAQGGMTGGAGAGMATPTGSGTSVTRSSASAGQAGTRAGAGAGPREEARTEGDITVPLMEERLEVEKRPTTLGEVEVRKEVTSEQVSVPVELSREEVRVRRENVEDRPVTEAEGRPFEEGTIRVPIQGEEAVVNKQAVVTGEVVIDRERTTERQDVTDTVRRERVDVDQAEGTSGARSTGAARAWDTVRDTHRQGWEQRYGSSGRSWQDAEPGYHYAHEMRDDERYRDRSWSEVEPDLRSGYGDWSRRRGYASGGGGDDGWQRLHQDVREAWEATQARTR